MPTSHRRDPQLDTKPDRPQTIDLVDLKDILGKAIKEPALRARLLADPEKTLKDMGYTPHTGAVDFFKSLDAHSFDAAAKAFKPHSGPQTGMAEL